MSRLLFCCALVGVAACVPAPDELSSDAPSLDGAWHLRVVPVRHDCPEAGDLAPVRPGFVRVEQTPGTLALRQPGADAHVLDAVSAGEWGTATTAVVQGCRVDAAQEWHTGSVGTTAFVATWTATYDLGAACDLPIDRCTVTYAVHGVR